MIKKEATHITKADFQRRNTHFKTNFELPLFSHDVWKLQKKVSFYIASEASYVYILSEQSLSSNSVTRQVNFNWTKMMKNAKIEILKCDILGTFI